MGLTYLAKVAAKDPVEAGFLVAQRFSPGLLVDRLARLGAVAGLRKPAFVMSFDCDTDRDIEVGWTVHCRLLDMGINAVYAVPGENLERGADLWRRIAATGAEFLNHGYREHTVYRDGRYVSTLFYDQMPPGEVEADVLKGHETVARIVGQAPDGFRAPHFGTYRKASELRGLHAILARLSYRFSSSTIPYVGLRNGPFTRRYGLTEIPVTGCPDYPLQILDSYSFRFAGNGHGPEGYIRQMARWASLLESGSPLFVNLYCDPSQVADWPEFFTAIRRMAPFARSGYRAVLDEISA
jgi:hypothetical protein